MTIRQVLSQAAKELETLAVPDHRHDAQALLAHVLGMDRLLMLSLHMEDNLPGNSLLQYRSLLARRMQREPLQYILGYAHFCGHQFVVRPGVLIPRQDTEVLCHQAKARLSPGQSALDVCTGSGCLAISLALACRESQVTAVDIDEGALALTRENASALGATVETLLGDLYTPVSGRQFDVILSNPPYIKGEELATLPPEVQQEPALALFGGSDGLDFYRRIIAAAPRHLAPGGFLLLELGQGQAQDVAALLPPGFTQPNLYQDLAGIPRVLEAQWTGSVR